MYAKGLLFALSSILVLVSSPVFVVAQQSTTNPINLAISKVSVGGKIENTRKDGSNNFIYDNELNLDDDMRYGWAGTDLNLKYKDAPAVGGGYLKIYLNDDTNEANLITEFGSSPLPVVKLRSKLVEGANKILFVYIDSTNRFPTQPTKVSFSFKFKGIANMYAGDGK